MARRRKKLPANDVIAIIGQLAAAFDTIHAVPTARRSRHCARSRQAHSASEAQHLIQLAHSAGISPRDASLQGSQLMQASDALPALVLFLTGDADFAGPVGYGA